MVGTWDFAWQRNYRLLQPIDLPRGTVLTLTGWYDNSADNPANPDPTALVEFGFRSGDEMLYCYFEYIELSDDDTLASAATPVEPEAR